MTTGEGWWCEPVLLFARASGLAAVMPWPVRLPARAALAAGLALFAWNGTSAADPAAVPGLLPREFFTGVLVSLPAALVVRAAALFGGLIDVCRGDQKAVTFDPGGGGARGGCPELLERLVWTRLVSLGLLSEVVRAFVATGAAVPPGAGASAAEVAVVVAAVAYRTAGGFLALAAPAFAAEGAAVVVSRLFPSLRSQDLPFLLKTVLLGSALAAAGTAPIDAAARWADPALLTGGGR